MNRRMGGFVRKSYQRGIIRDLELDWGVSQDEYEVDEESRELVQNELDLPVLYRPVEYCLPNKNCHVRVKVWSTDPNTKKIIRRAFKQLEDAPNFDKIFRKKNAIKAKRVKRKHKTKYEYVVQILFNDDYLKDVPGLGIF